MKVKQVNDKGINFCYYLTDEETPKDALLHFLVARMKICFAAQARPFPTMVDLKILKKEIHLPPDGSGHVVAPFDYKGVHCDLTVDQKDPTVPKLSYTCLSDKYTGTITTNSSMSGL